MADKIDRDRAKDSSIKTDDLDLGSIDDISLDFPGDGDEGIEFGKSRKPSNPKKDFAIEFAKGIGGGVKSAGVSELKKVLPEGAAIVSELGATFDDIRALKDDLSRQLGPMATTVENATRKLLPKAEKYLPKKLYAKAKKKLDERAESRRGYTGPSKEQLEQEQIAADLGSLFAAQAETSMAEMRDRKTDAMVDRAMGSMRHRQQVQHLTHLYDSMRATELFHKTQHMAYMKKSLELKYKHLFIARDTFNLLQQSMKTYEGYMKAILMNTGLPDMAKVKIGDYHRKSRTEKYGTMMSDALSNIRGKIMGKIKDSVSAAMGQAGFLTDMIGMGADMSDMGGPSNPVPGLLGKAVGYLGGSPLMKKMLGRIAPMTGALNTSLGGMKANAAVGMANLREKWMQSDNFFKNMLADFMPDTFSQSNTASNDLLSKSKDAATFDVITRQSITEIIPGYLGKILHEVTKIQTGNANVEEQVYNVYERKFTGIETLKGDVYDKAFGDKEVRQRMLSKTLAVMQAGAARNNPEKDAQMLFKGLEKDINRLFLNHAQYGIIFKPEELRNFINSPDDQPPSTYIRKVCNGFEHNPKQVLSAICDSLYGTDGQIDTNVKNDIQLAITENYRKMDQYKSELPEVMETYGYRQFFSGKLSGQEEKELRRIVGGTDAKKAQAAKRRLTENRGMITSIAGENALNFDEMVSRRGDIDYGEVSADKEDWDRRRAYQKYQTFDENVSKAVAAGSDWAQRFVDRTGMRVRGRGAEYDDIFHVAEADINAGRPEAKPGYKGNLRDTLKNIGVPTTLEGIKSKLRSAGEKASTTVKTAIEGLSPEVKTQYEKAKAKVTELKKQFEGTETGKQVMDQLDKLEKMYDEAAKQGENAIQYLRDEGAFDDPTGFLKKVYGSGTAAVKGWSDKLPSMTDTEGWKDLLQQKKDEVTQFAVTQAEALKQSKVGLTAATIGGTLRSKASEIISQAKGSEAGQKASAAFSSAKETILNAFAGLKGKATEGLREAGINIGGGTPPGGPAAPGVNLDSVVDESASAGSTDVVDRLDKILGVVTDWKKEATENQGTIFDAIAQVDEDVKNIKGGIGVGGALNEEELAKQLGKDMRKNSLLRKGLHAGKEALFGTARGLGRMYTGVYGAALKGAGQAAKGLGYAAGAAINSAYKAASGVGKWLTGKEDYVDIYVKGKEGGMPLVSARKQKDPDEGIFYKSSGKRVAHSRDIDEPCVDKRGQLVITEEDLKAGLVMNNSTPIGKIGAGALALAKGYFGVYGKAIEAIGGVVKTVAKGLFGSGVERWQDIYRKDEVGKGPLVTARQQKEEGVYFFESGKKVEKSSDIHEPVCDKDKKILISKEDVEHGLVDVNNKPLGSGGGGGALRALARGIGGALPGLGKFIGKAGGALMDIYGKGYTGLMELGFGALKGAGKFLGRALGLDLGGIGKIDEDLKKTIIDTNSVLHMMQLDLSAIAVKLHAKSMDGTKPTAETPTGTAEARTTTSADTSTSESATPASSTTASAESSDDPFGALKSKFGDLKSTVGSKLSGFFGGSKLIGTPLTKMLPEGDKKIETPEGTEITVEPPLAPATESAIVGTQSILGSIENKLSEFFTKQENKNPLDKDGDGDIDGSYADQMQNKKGGDSKRVNASDVHKDVNWLKDEKEEGGGGGGDGEKGGGLLDSLGKLIPKKYRKKFEAYKRLFSSKITKLAKGVGGRVLGVAKGFGSRALGLGAKAMPWLAKAGGAAMHGLGAVGSAAGGLLGSAGSAISGGLASMGGLAGIGSSLAAFAGPAALAALAGYGIYRGVKGFSKKNALENVGAGEGISKENQLTGEDRMYSALGLNSKIGAKTAKFVSQGLGIHGLIKGIRGNDNPLTDKEIEKGRTKLQRKIDKKLPGYDRILQEYEKAVEAGNWRRARELSGQEADGLITSMWKNSYLGMATKGLGNLIFGNKNEEMTKEEIEKTRAKFNSIISKGGSAGKNAEKLLSKFEDYVAEQDWKSARKIAGAEKRGLFGKLFQDSKGNVQWGKVIGLAAGGLVGYGIGALFTKTDVNKPMTEEEVKKARERLQKLADGGNKAASKILDQFDEAVTEQNWKKARKLVGEEVQSNLSKLGGALKFTAKWTTRIATLGLSTLFESDQDKPMSDTEIKKFTDKMNFLIEKKHDKLAQKKLDKFEEAVAAQKWDKARQIAKMPHKSLAERAVKATWNWVVGSDEEPMTEQEMTKFRESMQRKINMGSNSAKKKLDAFEDAVGAQRWKRARTIAQSPNDGWLTKGAKGVGKFAANSFRFFFGGDGKPMSETEIEQARKEMGWAISDGKKGAQKRLDLFNDYVADEKWEKARRLAKMPYENVGKRALKAVGSFLFGNDKEALSPEEIDKFQKECEQRVADGNVKAQKILDQFNSAVESENWKKARAISGMKNKGLFGSIGKGAKKVWDWFAGNSDYEDCQKIKEELEDKAMDDETGLIQKGLEDFEMLVRRQKYNDAMTMAKDLLKMKPSELSKKYKLKSEAYDELLKQGQELTSKIDKKIEGEKGWFSLNRMRLKSLRGDLLSNQESWSQDFFDDIKERLSSITGEEEFADIDKPDDGIVKKGEQLVKDIETSQGNYSWLGSPIIRTKLANLKSEVQGDMTTWSDETINTWKKRLKEIDKNYKGTEEQEDYEKGVTPLEEDKTEVKEGSPFTPDDVYVDPSTLLASQANSTEPVGAEPEPTTPNKFALMRKHALQRNTEVRSQFARGGFVKKFADGGFAKSNRDEVAKYEQLCEDLDNDKDLSEEDTYRALYYRYAAEGKPFKKPTEDDVIAVYGNADKKNFLKLLNLCRHAYGVGTWAMDHYDEAYEEREDEGFGLWDHIKGAGKGLARTAASPVTGLWNAGKGTATGDFNRDEYGDEDETLTEKIVSAPGKAISNGLGWIGKGIGSLFARGGFATSETPAIDSDGNPLVYGEAGTEAIMPIRSKPGNLLSRVGSKLGDILSGKPVGPMDDGASKASVHAGTDESEPMENMMANELAKKVKSRFAEGGFVDNIKERGKILGMTALKAALGPIFDTLLAAAIVAIAPAAFAMLGPMVITLVEMIATVEAAEAWEKGDYLKCAGFMLLGGAAPAVVVAFFSLLGVGGALMGGAFMSAAVVGEAMGLLKGINKSLLPEACQEYVDKAIDSIGTIYSAVSGAALGAAATPLTATWNLGKAAITGDFNRSEYIREDESALATALNAPHRAIDNAAGWAGKGIHAVGKGIGSLFGFGSSEETEKPKQGFSEESVRNEVLKNHPSSTEKLARGGFVNRFADGGFKKMTGSQFGLKFCREHFHEYSSAGQMEMAARDAALAYAKSLGMKASKFDIFCKIAKLKAVSEYERLAAMNPDDRESELESAEMEASAGELPSETESQATKTESKPVEEKKEESSGWGIWDHIKGAGTGLAKTVASPVTGLYKAGKTAITGEVERDEYDKDDETVTEAIFSAPGKAINNAFSWIGKGANSTGGAVVDGTKAVGSGIATAGGATIDGAKWVGEKTWDGTKTVGGALADGASAVGSGVSTAASKTWNGTKYLGGLVADGASAVGSGVVEGAKSAGSLAADGLGALGSIASGVASTALPAVAGVARQMQRPVGDASLLRRPVRALEGAAVDLASLASAHTTVPSTAEQMHKLATTITSTAQTPTTSQVVSGDDTAQKLAEMTEINHHLLDLLKTVLGPDGVKVSGIDVLTQVCAMSGASGGTAQPGPIQILQPQSENQMRGIDLRKRQM